MNELTKKVLTLQGTEKGSYEWDALFSEVFAGVHSSMESIVNSYAYSLRGDVAEGESVALEHLMTTVQSFKYAGFEFLTFFKKTLGNKMIDLVRNFNTNKNRHNTSYEVSLSEDVTDNDGNSYSMAERVQDNSLQTTDAYEWDTEDISIASLLEEFKAVKPVAADIIEIVMTYSPANGYQKKDMAQAVADYFEEDTYTNKLQARVSRSLRMFKGFADGRGYAFNF